MSKIIRFKSCINLQYQHWLVSSYSYELGCSGFGRSLLLNPLVAKDSIILRSDCSLLRYRLICDSISTNLSLWQILFSVPGVFWLSPTSSLIFQNLRSNLHLKTFSACICSSTLRSISIAKPTFSFLFLLSTPPSKAITSATTALEFFLILVDLCIFTSLIGVDYFDFDFDRFIVCTNTFTLVCPLCLPQFALLVLLGVALGVPISPITSFFL